MKLKPKERSAIMAGEHPEIARPYQQGETRPPFEKGELIVLSSQQTMGEPAPLVSITILGHNRTKKGAWVAEYSVRDDRGLYLARGPGYTRSRSGSLDPDASVEDPAILERYAAQGRLRRAESKELRERERQAQATAARSKLTEMLSGLEGEARTSFLVEFERLCGQAKVKQPA